MLGATGSRLSIGIAGDRLVGDSAPSTEASARRQQASAGCAGGTGFVCVTVRRQVLRGRAARHAMDRFHGRSHGLGPDNFGIPCGKQAKQAAVFKALVDLRIMRALRKGKKGQATQWAHGSRVIARLNGDECQSDADPTTQSRENLTLMIGESWRWSPWDELEGEGGEEAKGSTSLCSLINTSWS